MELDFSGKTVVFIGDIHGDPTSIIKTLADQGISLISMPSNVVLMWCGDYVDRGSHSIEALILVCALKLRYPNNVYVIRGNHETRECTNQYGFLMEVRTRMRTGNEMFRSAVYTLFTVLPVCIFASFNDGRKVFVAHGGFGPEVLSCAGPNALNTRLVDEQTHYSPKCIESITWSDPVDEDHPWTCNGRGAGCAYGPGLVTSFREKFGVEFIVRAHQVASAGISHNSNERVVTVFSVPNYCGQNNRGAIIIVRNGALPTTSTKNFEIVQFDSVPPIELVETQSPPGSSSETVSPPAAVDTEPIPQRADGVPAGFDMFGDHAMPAVFDGPPTSSAGAPAGPAPDLDMLMAMGF